MRCFWLIPVLALMVGGRAFGASPTGCSFPGSIDTYQAVYPGVRIMDACPPYMASCLPLNKLLCTIMGLQTAVSSVTSEVRTACTAASITPGARSLVTVTFSGDPLGGSEPTFGSVKDTLNPSRLDVDGIQSVSGNDVKVWVFNHDPNINRSGTVCVMVVP